MNKLLKASQVFLKKNSATILTVTGAVGVVATSVAAAKGATKASTLLREAEEFKGEELTFNEKFKIAAPFYIPAMLFGAATITCIFGANFLNKRKQASLVGAYTLLDRSYKEYKEKALELYGEDANDNINKEIANDKLSESSVTVGDDKELFYDLYSGRYFEFTMDKLLKAEIEVNKLMHAGFGASLNELYSLLGLETKPEYDDLGWNPVTMEEMYWHAWIEFTHTKTMLDDGLECTIIEFPLAPVADYLNY